MARGSLFSKLIGKKPVSDPRSITERVRDIEERRIRADLPQPSVEKEGAFSIKLSKDRSLGEADMVNHYCKTMNIQVTPEIADQAAVWLLDNRSKPAKEIAEHLAGLFSESSEPRS